MADAKWIKIAIDMFNDPKLKIINSMEEKDLINYVWMRSLLLAGQSNMNGCLYINESMPYTMKTLAIEFDRAFEEVKLAFKVLRKLEMLEVTEDRIFRVKNWAKHQNVDELEKLKKQNCDRVAKYRAKKKELEESNKKNVTEINIDKDRSHYDIANTQNDNNINDEFKESIKNDNFNITYNDTENIKTQKQNITENRGNVTNIQSNITVMEQNKKENKIENKNNKREIENNYNSDLINSTNSFDDSFENHEINSEYRNEKAVSTIDNSQLSSSAIKLMQHYEQVTGFVGGLDIGSLRLAVTDHGELNVRRAIDKAIENGKNKGSMRYINGILRNWRKEGYPEDDVGGINNGAKPNGKGSRADSKQFKKIKPKKCRELTEEERTNLGAVLI